MGIFCHMTYTRFTFLSVRVYVIGAILVCLSITLVILEQAQVALECRCAVQGQKQRCSLQYPHLALPTSHLLTIHYQTMCQGRNSGGRRYKVIARNHTLFWSNVQMSGRNVLSDDRKKTLATRQGHQGGERLIERPWLQLICCAPVSGREVGRVFWSEGSRQDRGPKESSEGAGVDKDQMTLIHRLRNYTVITQYLQ